MARRKKSRKGERCINCNGYGIDPVTRKNCTRCLGTGLEAVYLPEHLKPTKDDPTNERSN